MNNPLGDTPKRIFSWKQLIGVMLACGITLVLLMPDDPTLLEDLIRDQKTAEARRVLEKIPRSERKVDALRYAIAEQRIEQIELGVEPGEADIESYVIRAAKRWKDYAFSDRLLLIWIVDLPRLKSLDLAWLNLTGNWADVPHTQRVRLNEVLVDLSLEMERAELGAALYAQTYGESPELSHHAKELARLFRLAGDADRALHALEKAPGNDLGALRIALLRELNSNDRALTELLKEIENETAMSSEKIQQLVVIARSAGQSGRAIPQTLKFLEANPSDLVVSQGLVILQRESGQAIEAAASQAKVVSLSGRDPAELREWGRLLEGAGQPNEAFDVWIELSLQEDRVALDRMMALNPGLYRDRELADVLLANVPVENQADYTLSLAQLLSTLGRYDEAVIAYELYFDAVPKDHVAMLELAVLEIELYRYAEAAKWLQRVKSEGQGTPSTRRKLGDAWTAMGEFNLALDEYRAVAEATGLLDDYGSYFRLARGVGAHEDFVAGLEGIIRKDAAEPANYLTLSYGYQLLGDEDRSRATLREGMVRFPKNEDMPMRLAYAYSDEKRYREAQEVLGLHPELGRKIEPTRLYLILMRLNEDVVAEKRFLQRKLPDVVQNDPESKQHLARIHSTQGRLDVAERMLRELHDSFPTDWDLSAELIYVLQRRGKHEAAQLLLEPLLVEGSAQAWRLAADVAIQMGEYVNAEGYQVKYLALVSPALPTDWGALGDIRLSRGDRVGAKRAYTRALRELQLTLLASAESEP